MWAFRANACANRTVIKCIAPKGSTADPQGLHTDGDTQETDALPELSHTRPATNRPFSALTDKRCWLSGDKATPQDVAAPGRAG